jgi:hypothetical protein
MPKIENRENQSQKPIQTGLTRHFYGGQAGETGKHIWGAAITSQDEVFLSFIRKLRKIL